MYTTSLRLKFRASANPAKEGSLLFQLIHHRSVRKIKSAYRIYLDEWDAEHGQILLPPVSSPRHAQLALIRQQVEREMGQLRRIVEKLELSASPWSLDDVVSQFTPGGNTSASVFGFMRRQIQYKRQLGKIRSSETYAATLRSLMRFREGEDLPFRELDAVLMERYESYLLRQGLTRNTTSFYMRVLRANYRQAVEMGLTPDLDPFRHVYCGIDKTVKRSLSLADIKRIKELDLSNSLARAYARDMFLFSFFTRGMSFVDMAYLTKQDLKGGYLSYRRKKTGQLLTMEWTRQMQAIVEKYPPNPTRYLLPIITREDGTERRQYQNQMMKINRHLKHIAGLLKLPVALSLYYTRHSWATIARGKDIPLAVISEGLGHHSEVTTQIYLDSIKSWEVDKANREIMKGL